MTRRLDTVQDVEKAFGLPPEATQEVAGERSARGSANVASEHAFALSSPASVHGVVFSTIAVRPVRVADWLEFGDVETWQMGPDNMPFRFPKLDATRNYMERVISVPGEPDLRGADILLSLSLKDALLVRDRVVGFFGLPPLAAFERS